MDIVEVKDGKLTLPTASLSTQVPVPPAVRVIRAAAIHMGTVWATKVPWFFCTSRSRTMIAKRDDRSRLRQFQLIELVKQLADVEIGI